MNDLLHTLEKELESAVDWFENNNMIANPDKFQAIIMNKRRENQITYKLKIYNNKIGTTKSVKLLVTEIYNQLSFNQHISKLCSLNLLLCYLMSSIFAHVNLRKKKIEKIQKRCPRLVLDDYGAIMEI